MSEVHAGSGSARGASQFEARGKWPTINLIVLEGEDFEHEGSSFTDGSGADSAQGSSEATVLTPNPTYILRIHTDITIDKTTYNRLSAALANGKNPAGRKKAFEDELKNHPVLQLGSDTARAMVAAAFDVT